MIELIKDKNNGYIVLSKVEYIFVHDSGPNWVHRWLVIAVINGKQHEIREFDSESMCHIWIKKHFNRKSAEND